MGIEPTYLAWKASVLPLNYTRMCPEPESNQRHEDFQSSALPTELSGQKKIAGAGFEPTTFGLWARRASRLLHPATIFSCRLSPKWMEKDSNLRSRRQQIYSLPPLATREPIHKPLTGLEPVTCWLQISCSANWATTACCFYMWLYPHIAFPFLETLYILLW